MGSAAAFEALSKGTALTLATTDLQTSELADLTVSLGKQ